jgi:predicted membrane channel-forming protein YqfA (hemolysin III family)
MAPATSSKLHHRCETPAYLLVHFVNSGYRVDLSYEECVRSMFTRHNETSNIWTSMVLLIIVVCLFPYVMIYELHYSTTSFMDYFVFSIYFIYLMCTAITRLAFQDCIGFVIKSNHLRFILVSVVYHTFRCHSEYANCKSMQIDFVGILLTGFACAMPGLYYGFWRFEFWQTFYIILSLILR